VYIVDAEFPENVDIPPVIVFVIPVVDKSGPDINWLNGNPKTVAPDKCVIVSGDCNICLLLE
jgi:hypothetical protein